MGKRNANHGFGRRWSVAAAFATLTLLARPLAAQEDGARRFAMFDGVSLLESSERAIAEPALSLGLQEEAKHAPEPVRPPGRRRFFTAAAELALLEAIPWAFDRYIGKYDYAYISTETVRKNFKRASSSTQRGRTDTASGSRACLLSWAASSGNAAWRTRAPPQTISSIRRWAE